MTTDYAPILQDVERELADLLTDKAQLEELRNKYTAQYEAAETEWKAKRTGESMEAMQKAMSFRDTVLASLKEQEHEIAKARAYVTTLQERLRQQRILAEISEAAARLAQVQQEHTDGMLKLYEVVWQQLSELGQLRAEWQGKQLEAWQKGRTLGANMQEGTQIAHKAGVDVDVLRVAPPIHGSVLLGHQKPYTLPMPERSEAQFVGEALMISGLFVNKRFVDQAKAGEEQ